MTQFKKEVFSLVLVAGLLAPAAFAGSKEDAHELLAKSFQQANIWNQGPVKLVAKVRMPTGAAGDLNLEYTVSWAGPDKWRAEWSAPGLQQVTVLNNGKLSYISNQPTPLVRAIEFEAAIAALDGGSPAGPFPFAPQDFAKAKIDVSKKKINGAEAKCLAWGQPTTTFCVDSASGHLVSADGDLGTFEYSDYSTAGSTAYPQTVKVSYVKTLMEDAKVTVTRGDKFEDALFTPPDKSTTVDFASCADVDKNFTAPRLDKPVKAKMPDAARKAGKYGMVWVLSTVGADGAVQKTTVLGGEPELSAAATDAVKQYRFSPYTRCGQAVAFQDVVVVPFAPPPQGPPDISVPTK